MSSGQPVPQNPYPQQPQPTGPYPAPPPKSNTGLVLLIIGLVAIPVMLVCGGILVALLLPAVQAGREAARRMACSNNMKQIGLAMHNYHDAYGSFPPAYTVDESGQRLHSWRTLILPFMEQQALHESIDFSKPWDDPANQMAANTMIPAYACPSSAIDPTMTSYVAVVDPSAVMSGTDGIKIRAILDGTSNTIMVTEVASEDAVPWMSPNDISMPAFVNMAASGRGNHPGGGNVLFCDGSVQFMTENTDANVRSSLVTRDAQD
ncbi:DUF1559 domain-containing protein [Roseimaritima ulvae]|uniref:DUF1559 domain-containing protein n=1 Tax=Roseimaritima ulvae TaxID=980254 RepID=A0A5B9R0Q8_9BACT|nr:DUF1559 domain-containing protein [Roseimaritima ulvae]QEG43849.1 hypothetical protein UC8_59060 [Roseimaritima ulvae]